MKHHSFPKSILLIALTVTISLTSFAEEFNVKSFKKDESDLAARRFDREDINGEKCALIKIKTDQLGLKFSSGFGIVGNVEFKEGQYWVYVTPGERRLSIFKTGFVRLDYDFPLPIESYGVYHMVLVAEGQTASLDKGLIKTIFRFNTPNVFIYKDQTAPVQVKGDVAEYRLPRGSYQFRFAKEGFNDFVKEFVVTNEQLIEITLGNGVQKQGLRLPAILSINSQPTGADIFLNGQKIGQSPYTGQIIAGNYDLILKYDLYHSYQGSFSIQEGETNELPLISLKPKYGFLNVISDPLGAAVYIDEQLFGVTPIAHKMIESGDHRLKLTMDLYHDADTVISILDGEEESVNCHLKEAFGKLVVESQPVGADVYLDGKKKGETPLTVEKLVSGSYELTVSMPMWSVEKESVIITDGQGVKKIMVLNKDFGEVTIWAKDADIYQDSRKAGDNEYYAQLKPGKYTFSAKREKHLDAVQEVFISIGEHKEVTLHPVPIQGSLSVFTNPPDTKGASIFINGRQSDKTAPAVIPLLIGNYEVMLQKEGYLDSRKNVNIETNKNQQVTFEMQTFKGSLQQVLKKYKKRKLFWASAAVIFTGVGTYYFIASEQHYDDYQATTSSIEAADLHDQVDQEETISMICFGAAGAALIPTIVNAVKQNNTKDKIQFATKPIEKGAVLSVQVNF